MLANAHDTLAGAWAVPGCTIGMAL